MASSVNLKIKKEKKKKKAPQKVVNSYAIKRLSLYLRDLQRLKDSGVKVISSSKIPQTLDVSASQFRKDLSYFGEFGKRGVGYKVDLLVDEIENILGVNVVWDVAVIGLGRLGSALLSYPGFWKFNLRIGAVFESDKRKIGRIYSGIKVENIKNIKKIVKTRGIKIAMLCVPSEVVPDVLTLLDDSKVKAILNFTPVNLKANNGILISNVDMSSELQTLIYFLKNTKP